jgi:hypothetical protein
MKRSDRGAFLFAGVGWGGVGYILSCFVEDETYPWRVLGTLDTIPDTTSDGTHGKGGTQVREDDIWANQFRVMSDFD